MSGLAAPIAAVEKALKRHDRATAGTSASANYDRWHAARRSADSALLFELEAAGATVRVACSEGSRVRLGGFAAASTCGLTGAAQNWLAAAKKREAAQ